MASNTNKIITRYDFSEALALNLPQRFTRSIERARELLDINAYQKFVDFPCIPAEGASEEELVKVESELGLALPAEYREFLAMYRYLKIDDGHEIGGLAHQGIHVTENPWISKKHRTGISYLVFANFWSFADGDQLMFDLSDATHPVIAYLHDYGPLFEAYAPSFSLALWRLVFEIEYEDLDEDE